MEWLKREKEKEKACKCKDIHKEQNLTNVNEQDGYSCFLGVEKSTLGLVCLRKCRACERIQESQMPFKSINLIKLAKLSHHAFLGREGCLDGKKATNPETLAS